MFKKFLSLAIVLMLVAGMAAVAASAAQVEISDNAADTPAEVGADTPAEIGADGAADTGAESGADTAASGSKIYFDANTSGWNNYSVIMVYCYMPETGDIQIDWGSRKKGGMTDEGNGIWSYDFAAKGIDIDPNKQYAVIFNADTGAQTCDLLFETCCFGDTAYCESDKFLENTDDSNKKSVVVRWKNNPQLGPKKAITSLGHIVGETIPSYTSPYKMFVSFLADGGAKGIQNAKLYSDGKSYQEIIDETAANLGLQKGDVKMAIAEAAQPDPDNGRQDSFDLSKEWDESKSPLPDGENKEAHQTGDGGTDNSAKGGSGSNSGGSSDSGSGSGSDSSSGGSGSSSGSDSGSGSSGSSASGSGSGSSSASGSGSGSQTGQETTVVFIMLGVMVAAAVAIILIRRKNRS